MELYHSGNTHLGVSATDGLIEKPKMRAEDALVRLEEVSLISTTMFH